MIGIGYDFEGSKGYISFMLVGHCQGTVCMFCRSHTFRLPKCKCLLHAEASQSVAAFVVAIRFFCLSLSPSLYLSPSLLYIRRYVYLETEREDLKSKTLIITSIRTLI